MRRLSVPVDPDVLRALQYRAAGAQRDVRAQAAHELERALVEAFRPAAPPESDTEQKGRAPGGPCKAPGARGEGQA